MTVSALHATTDTASAEISVTGSLTLGVNWAAIPGPGDYPFRVKAELHSDSAYPAQIIDFTLRVGGDCDFSAISQLTQTAFIPSSITMSHEESRTETFAFEHGLESDPNFALCQINYSLVVVSSLDGLAASHDFIEIVGTSIQINDLLDKLGPSHFGKSYEFQIEAHLDTLTAASPPFQLNILDVCQNADASGFVMDSTMISDADATFLIEAGSFATVLAFDDHVTLVSPCEIIFSTNPSVSWLTVDPAGPSLSIYTEDVLHEGVHAIEVIGTINTYPPTVDSFFLSVAISADPCLKISIEE